MKGFLLLITICFSSVSFGQQAIFEWEKSFGGSDFDEAYCIDQTDDGGYIVVGHSTSNDGDLNYNYGIRDCYILKLDATGHKMWQKIFGGTGTESIQSIQQTSDGGYIAAGYSNSNDFDVIGNHGGFDFWILKLDVFGNIIWQRSLGGSFTEHAYSIKQTSDGGYIVTGDASSNDGDLTVNYYGSDFWVVKLDEFGNIIWQKSFGGSNSDYPKSVEQTMDGGYIITGITGSNDGDITLNQGFLDCWIVKLDNTGDLIWQKTIGGSNYDFAESISQTIDGGYILAGRTESTDGDINENNGQYDSWVVKLDALGNISWQKTFGGTFFDGAFSIQQVNDEGYIVVGSSSSNDGDVVGNNGGLDYWILKLDGIGNINWQKSLGGTNNEGATSVKQTIDGGFIIAGMSSSGDGNVSEYFGGNDFWIVKLKTINFQGVVFNDLSLGCDINDDELGIEGINLTITPGNYIVTTNNDGLWYLDSLPVGTYTVTLDTTNLNWSPTCPVTQTFIVTDPSVFTPGPSFGLINDNPCTDPDVSIFAPSLRRCFSNRLVYVSACNQVTATGILDSSYVDVELDPLLTVNSASLPYTDLGNNTFRFETGDIYPGQCVNFTLSTTVSCDAQNGQTLCMDATLYPAEDCVFDSIPSDPVTN
ncbi:hypothetical protein OAV26_03535, partial [Crocinitomicaceae bacterium]|nr:hypothetical protein [Crocinitomicaceae bacterium]